MDVILYGFYSNMNQHNMREEYLYLLVFGFLVLLGGRFLMKRRMDQDYSRLIRVGRLSDWWHRQVCRTIALGIAEVSVLFLLGNIWLRMQKVEQSYGLVAFFLWMLGLVTAHLIQLCMIHYRNWYKFSFPLILGIMAVSLYHPAFPGSFLMLRRSSLVIEGGYSVWTVAGIELAIAVPIGCAGHWIVKKNI